MSPTPSPVPEKKTPVLWWVLGLLGAGVALFAIGGLFFASYLVKTVQIQPAAQGVEIQTPAGSIRASRESPVDTGLPVYPGASVADTGGTVEIEAPTDDTVRIAAVHYRTSDPLEKVDAWYRDQLGPEFQREGPGVMVRKKEVLGMPVRSSDIAYIAEGSEWLRVVVIERKGLHTEIGLARIGQPEAQ